VAFIRGARKVGRPYSSAQRFPTLGRENGFGQLTACAAFANQSSTHLTIHQWITSFH
jgi:hypothetical protein